MTKNKSAALSAISSTFSSGKGIGRGGPPEERIAKYTEILTKGTHERRGKQRKLNARLVVMYVGKLLKLQPDPAKVPEQVKKVANWSLATDALKAYAAELDIETKIMLAAFGVNETGQVVKPKAPEAEKPEEQAKKKVKHS